MCQCNVAPGESIWAKRDKNMRGIYVDDVARQIGDILTVNITEDSKVDNKAKRDLQKSTDRSTAFDGELGIDHVLPSIPGFNMSAKSSNTLSGKADFKDERSYVDSISVVVVDIQPNGNLVIMGVRDRDITGDIQMIEVSGIVRPSDIAFNNSIKSQQIANFRVVTKSKGVAEPYNRPGWLGKLFDIIWPF
jgi:flagellar L-ring protein precursor FlgH